MRDFFLRDTFLTSCGTGGPGNGGYAYFCPKCGEIWGRVRLGSPEWLAVSWPCENHSGYRGQIPGSFLKPLIWWDYPNGNSLKSQLRNASAELIRHEAQARARYWLEKDK